MAAAEAQERRPVIAHCHLGLGRLSPRIGKCQEAEGHWEPFQGPLDRDRSGPSGHSFNGKHDRRLCGQHDLCGHKQNNRSKPD
jgi:hypothetical protein